jgi:hypothetical protein
VKVTIAAMDVNSTKPFYKMTVFGQLESVEFVLDCIPDTLSEYYYFLFTSWEEKITRAGHYEPESKGIGGLLLEAVPTCKGHFYRIAYGKFPASQHLPTYEDETVSIPSFDELEIEDEPTTESHAQAAFGPDDLVFPLIGLAQRPPESRAEDDIYERVVEEEDGSLRYEIVLV